MRIVAIVAIISIIAIAATLLATVSAAWAADYRMYVVTDGTGNQVCTEEGKCTFARSELDQAKALAEQVRRAKGFAYLWLRAAETIDPERATLRWFEFEPLQ